MQQYAFTVESADEVKSGDCIWVIEGVPGAATYQLAAFFLFIDRFSAPFKELGVCAQHRRDFCCALSGPGVNVGITIPLDCGQHSWLAELEHAFKKDQSLYDLTSRPDAIRALATLSGLQFLLSVRDA